MSYGKERAGEIDRRREFERLLDVYGAKPRKERNKVVFEDYTFDVPDCLSFVYQYREIFADRAYAIAASHAEPIIYDCGANIGMASLFFASEHPQARIEAFEADPMLAHIASANLAGNGVRNMHMHAVAVSDSDGLMDFFPDGADGGNATAGEEYIAVPALRLRTLLVEEPYVDLLKMDIEGMELSVLGDCAALLPKVDHVFVEYHSRADKPQELHALLALLAASDFRYFTTCNSMRKAPFLNRDSGVFDLLVNIWAYR